MPRFMRSIICCLLVSFCLPFSFCFTAIAQNADDAPSDVPELKFTPLELLSIVELNIRGKSEPKKPLTIRLEECERISGLTTEITASLSFDRRLLDLLQEAPISAPLMDFVETRSKDSPEFFKKKQYLFSWYATLYQLITASEIAKYSEPALGKSLLKRVERMELEILKLKKPPEGKNLAERVSDIVDAVDPTEKNIGQAVEATDKLFQFMMPAEPGTRPMPNSPMSIPGSGVFGATYKTTAKVLRSPTFWKVVGATAVVGGLVVGAIFLAKSGGGGNSSYGYDERGCNGDPLCLVCKNCNYCAHCKNPYFLGPCGVYLRVRGLVP